MIVNELDRAELTLLLRPILRLAPAQEVLATLAEVLHVSSATRDALMCQRETMVTFAGYRVDITDLRWVGDKPGSIILQFKAPQKWWHVWRDQNVGLVRMLQQLCAREIKDLAWRKYTKDLFDELGQPTTLIFYHDSRAFNAEWEQGSEVSPLLICPDAHHNKCFVELMFNGGAYVRKNRTTVLRDDWLSSVSDVRKDLERSAAQLTADFLAGKPTSLDKVGIRLVKAHDTPGHGE
jgi:hypothetical protein